MQTIKSNLVLDAQGLACPMPIVKTKKAMNEILPGEVLEVVATDKGSKADIKAWAESTGNQYLGTIEEGTVLKHYLRKSTQEEMVEKKHPHVINNDELLAKLDVNDNIVILDVRESAEYAFNHIPGAISLPLAEIETRMSELNINDTIYVVCRTGNRSDVVAQKLAEQGFAHVYNVVPGMSHWTGKTISINN